ncbi:hypothetical protein M427DRAFT_313668 [Gonapodya prolifera JEL478]|uniref:Ceramidase n=1 Tax=Gonapodya prolifera (strain JEL478) TaxID=1344416 RepID=A0A139AWY0_GONPJ|nr:hypothetical protein M427DRAFT_313668 [Gonapodya prolifera JEL478]|eukprot:KXS21209.1 hypothetical protein M427DRAFT_313668 [Gonapodya prolifera JEL478]
MSAPDPTNGTGFCESSNLSPGTPEYFSAATAPFITLFALYGLLGSYRQPPSVCLVYAFVAVNGVVSFMGHWVATHDSVWSVLDQLTIVIPLFLADYGLLDDVTRHWARDKVLSNTAYNIVKALSSLGAAGGITLAIGLSPLSTTTLEIIFIVLAVVLFALVYLTYRQGRGRGVSMLPVASVVVMVIAAVFWNTNERFCSAIPPERRRFVPGHALWHIAIGFGVYIITQYATYVLHDSGVRRIKMTPTLRVIIEDIGRTHTVRPDVGNALPSWLQRKPSLSKFWVRANPKPEAKGEGDLARDMESGAVAVRLSPGCARHHVTWPHPSCKPAGELPLEPSQSTIYID